MNKFLDRNENSLTPVYTFQKKLQIILTFSFSIFSNCVQADNCIRKLHFLFVQSYAAQQIKGVFVDVKQ